MIPAVCVGADESPLPAGFHLAIYRDDAGAHRYLLSLPSDYSPERTWPVVLFLHGAGERGTDGIKPLSIGLGVALEQQPAPWISVFPQCEETDGRILDGWLSGSAAAERALAILKQVESEYAVDPERRILCGWSMGGYGAWSLAASDPPHWSALLTISGGIPNGLDLKPLAEAGTPVWAIHGRDDALIPAERSIEAAQRLKELGGNARVTILDGRGHDVWRDVFANPQVHNWMLDPPGVDYDSIRWDEVERLPDRSRFYREHFSRFRRVSDSVSLRLGNRGLDGISAAIPELLPESALNGHLPDMERRLGSGANVIRVQLSDLSYRCRVAQVSLRSISGGRFLVRFGVQPLELQIGAGRLDSEKHRARVERLSVVIGHRRPAFLEVEVAPSADDDGLRLVPLRQRFEIDHGNWFIRSPEQVTVDSPTLTADHVVTGLVGGLYLRRAEMEQQVLGVVPALLEVVERELSAVPAPRLARLLWPLPALVPEVALVPTEIRSDPDGMSLLLDLRVEVDRDGVDLHPRPPLTIAAVEPRRDLQMQLAIDSVRQLSRITIDDGMAHIDVRDLPEDRFAALADVRTMKQVFPRLSASPPETQLRCVLRLREPFSFDIADLPASSASVDMESPVMERLHLTFHASEVGIDFWEPTAQGWRGLGRAIVAVRQPVEIEFTHRSDPDLLWNSSADSAGVETLNVVWGVEPSIEVVRIEPLDGITVEADADRFRQVFTDVWKDWIVQQQPRTLSMDSLRLGTAALRLDSVRTGEGRLQFRLSAESPASGRSR